MSPDADDIICIFVIAYVSTFLLLVCPLLDTAAGSSSGGTKITYALLPAFHHPPSSVKTDDHSALLGKANGQRRSDPTGTRARALQRQVDVACSSGRQGSSSGGGHAGGGVTIRLDGEYNFSAHSLLLDGCVGLSLLGSGPATTTLLFIADTGADLIDPGINVTNSHRSKLQMFSIDYHPKPRTCMCFSRKTDGGKPYPPWRPAPLPGCPPASTGITLHFQNSSSMLAEDVTLHAAPFMAITSVRKFPVAAGHTSTSRTRIDYFQCVRAIILHCS